MGLFGLPEMDSKPVCFIVVPTIKKLNVQASRQDDSAVGELSLPEPIQWGPDVACASELQSMIATVLGTAPHWISPEAAIMHTRNAKEPAIMFSVGLWSNAFSRFVCEAGSGSIQSLLRLPMQAAGEGEKVQPGWPGCMVLSALPTTSGYQVDTHSNKTEVPPGYMGNQIVLLRARGPAPGHVACCVVGGLAGAGTSVIGKYLRESWRDLCKMTDTTTARSIRNHQYLIELITILGGGVGATSVKTGAGLHR